MPKSKKTKHAGGRPSKWKPEFCKKLIEYFSIPPYREIDGKLISNDIRFFDGFARSIGVNDDTLREWCKKHSEFSASYNEAKELQKNFLIQNGLKGLYNAPFAIFTAKNITDMRDKTDLDIKTEITGQVGCILIPSGDRYAKEQIESKKKYSLGATT